MNTTDNEHLAVPNLSYSNSTGLDYSSMYIFSVFHVTNFVVGLPVNSWVVWLILTGSGVAAEIFPLNLSMTEILYCIGTPLTIVYTYIPEVALGKVAAFMWGIIWICRPLFQCCVCVERYLAVVHPVVFLKYRPLRYRVRCSGLVWFVVLVSSVVFGIFYPHVPHYGILVLFLIPFLVMLFCCLSILRALKKPGPGDGEKESGNNLKMKKAFKIILILMTSVAVNYIPLLVVVILIDQSNRVELIAPSVCINMAVLCGLVQPFLYLHRAGKLPCTRSPTDD